MTTADVSKQGLHLDPLDHGRRKFLSSTALGTATIAVPSIGNAQTSAGKRLSIQSLWSENTIGYKTFKTWCESIQELTAAEVDLVPYPGGSVAEVFDMVTATSSSVLDAMLWVSHSQNRLLEYTSSTHNNLARDQLCGMYYQ